jgi:hypothetical protein
MNDACHEFVQRMTDDVYRYTWRWIIYFGEPIGADLQRCVEYVFACMNGGDSPQLLLDELRQRGID